MKTILFDFDGTLADTLPILIPLLEELAKKYPKYNLNLNNFRERNIVDILKELKIPYYQILIGTRKIKKELRSKAIHTCPAFLGLEPLLSYLSTKYRLGILSSNSKENINAFLSNNKMDKYFSFIYADSPLFWKDKTISKVLRKEKISKEQVIYIGDENRDVIACKKANIPIISVTWGYNSKKFLSKENQNYLADKPEDIKNILEEMKF